MGIASGDHGFSPIARQHGGRAVVVLRDLSIQGLHGRKEIFKKQEIEIRAAAGEARENVIDAEENILLAQISSQRRDITAAALQLDVIALLRSGRNRGIGGELRRHRWNHDR